MAAIPCRLLPLTLLAAVFASPAPSQVVGYARMPALRGDTLVFVSEGDLWRVPATGGLALRLTSHPGEERDPVLSPDGRWIAFSSQFEGPGDVYRMAIDGGLPERLTAESGRVFVQGFRADGAILYTSEDVVGPTWRRVLRAVHPESGKLEELPLADVTEAAVAADGSIVFTRFGLTLTGDHAVGYAGGARSRLYRFRSGDAEATEILTPVPVTRPMPHGDRLIVLGEKEGRWNLLSLAADGSDPRWLTGHRDFDVRGPRLDGDRIVYQHGAGLRRHDLATGKDAALEVALASDALPRRPRIVRKPLAHLDSIALSADGSRVLLAARGQLALASPGALRRVEVRLPEPARLREAVLPAGGRHLYGLVDRGPASELWRFPVDGAGAGEKLPIEDDRHRWRLYPSPDGKWLAHDDKGGRLWLTETATGRTRLFDQAGHGRDDVYQGVAFSPDGKWLALARPNGPRLRSQLLLREIAGERLAVLTSDRYDSMLPRFSADGRWLYFVSNRNFQVAQPTGPWGDRNTGPSFDKRGRVYALALQAGNRPVFQPPDELTSSAVAPTGEAPAAIEIDGLAERLYEAPVPAANLLAFEVGSDRLYWLEREASPADAKPVLKSLALAEDGKPELLAPDVQRFWLSADRRKLLLQKSGSDPAQPNLPGDLLLVDAGPKLPEDLARAKVRLADWSVRIDPAEEWRQMFDDAMRLHREFSFDPAMRGVDWQAVVARHRPLVERVGDRLELDDLLAQAIAELGVLHSQVRGGDYRRDPEQPAPARLGGQFVPDAGGLKLVRVWNSDPELPGERSPLSAPGVDVRIGDLLQAVNGQSVASLLDLDRALAGRAGQQVLLQLSRGREARRAVVVPVDLTRDATLRYGDWVQGNRERVEAESQGRIGYLHLRAMGPPDIASFVRDFYAVFDREGLILDVRRNRGGNIDAWLLEKLLKRAWAFWQPPGATPYWNQQQAFRGHLVVLADELTYSDGETFAAGIKALSLGPVIGKRTAGAGIWLSDRNRLVDGGLARIGEFGQFDMRGRWLIEGTGVAPDIEVDNPPHATWRGEDAQLAAALAELSRRIAERPLPPLLAEPIPPRGRGGHDGSR